MDALYEKQPEFGFGVDPLNPHATRPIEIVGGQDRETLKQAILQSCPRIPGVYGMLDRTGCLIYVGKSKALRNRLLSYFMPNNEEDKSGRIAQTAAGIVWEPQPSEFAALLREQFLIRKFRPRFNVQGMPKRQQPIFICLGRSPAEQLFTARRPEPKAIAQVGPLFGASRAGRAVEVLNRSFGLRDCSSKQPCSFTDQMQLFDIELRPGCIRLEMQSCLGPCISACSRSSYESQVKLARKFLMGSTEQPVLDLEQAMLTAADNRHFERAITLREDLAAVRWLYRRVTELAQARRRYTFVYAVKGTDCNRRPGAASNRYDIWYLIRRGMIEAALPAPQSADQREQAHQCVKEWLVRDGDVGGQYSPREETLALVTSWLRNNRGELKSTFLPEGCTARSVRKTTEKPSSSMVASTAALDTSTPETPRQAVKA